MPIQGPSVCKDGGSMLLIEGFLKSIENEFKKSSMGRTTDFGLKIEALA